MDSNQPDIAKLRTSWAKVASFGPAVPKWFYAYLFLTHPDTRALFPADMSYQRDKLVNALGDVIANLDDPDTIVPKLQHLGRSHRRFGAIEAHYPAVGQAFLATLKHFLGDDWTPELAAHWDAAYKTIASIMIGAARAAHREPQWWDSKIIDVTLGVEGASVFFDPPDELALEPGLEIPVSLDGAPGGWLTVRPFPVDVGWVIDVDVTDDPRTLALALAQPGDLLRLGPPNEAVEDR